MIRGRRRGALLLIAALLSVTFVVGHEQVPRAEASLIAAVSAGTYSTCALTAAGGVKCWGDNGYGELGNGTTSYSATPVDVIGLTSGATAVSSGQHTCAVTAAGGAQCWGDNQFGELGNGATSVSNSTPLDVTGLTSGVANVSASGYLTCALTMAGGAKCWGNNQAGQVGNGTINGPDCSGSCYASPVAVSGLASGVAAVSSGGDHACALTAAGGVKCWGDNSGGQLGNGTSGSWSTTPVDVTGLTSGVAAVSAGQQFTCALTSVGGMKCWGADTYGQLGNGTSGSYSTTPVDVTGLTSGVAAVSAGAFSTCALTAGGGVKCWGDNSAGGLGDGTTTLRNTPVDVTGLTSGAAAVSVGLWDACARTTDGSVKCWGYNYQGELGNGTTNDSHVPVSAIGVGPDTDGDGCPDKSEQQTAVGSEITGGRRDYLNPYDYFNPTNDGLNRIDDILAVVGRYYSSGNPAGPLNTIPPPPPAYDAKFNRAPLGPNVWNLTQGNGQVLLADILAVVKQYFHDCGSGIVKV